jgi:glycosyltransferase involved in cell wall biosynthesis
MTRVSVLLPAHDESAYLPGCLDALLGSRIDGLEPEVIVIANGCRDDTADIARNYGAQAQASGWRLQVIERVEGDKLKALNAGEAEAKGDALIYLDADVRVSPELIAQLAGALSGDRPAFAGGTPRVVSGASRVTHRYGAFWQTVPFLRDGVPGFGIFAMNRAGRARWDAWPDIISDDTFARLNFRPDERKRVPATYDWPMVEGFAPLVRVRRRQDAGVAEIGRLFPQLLENEDAPARIDPLWQRAVRNPLNFVTFAAVRLAARSPFFRSGQRWSRGR